LKLTRFPRFLIVATIKEFWD